MSKAKVTLLGFYNYFNLRNENLFIKLVLPAGIDKNILIDNILLRSGEFEVLYTDPDFLMDAIELWSKKWYNTFERWYKALKIEYNPLENYDRMEESESSNNTNSKATSSGVGQVSAFNSSAFENDTKSDGSSNVDSNGSMKSKSRMHGNIGVTTSQQMLEAELNISKWNLYEHITDIFLQEFVVPIY